MGLSPNVEQLLRAAPVDDATRADAWEVLRNAKSRDDIASGLKSINLPQETKADLWESYTPGVNQPPPGQFQTQPGGEIYNANDLGSKPIQYPTVRKAIAGSKVRAAMPSFPQQVQQESVEQGTSRGPGEGYSEPANRLLTGVLKTTLPGAAVALAPAAIAAPIPTALGLVGGTVAGLAGQQVGSRVTKALGGTQGQQDLAGNITGLVTGAAGGYGSAKLGGVLTAPPDEKALSLFKRAVKPSGMSAEDDAALTDDFNRAKRYISPEMSGPKLSRENGLMNTAQVADNAAEKIWYKTVEPVLDTEHGYGNVPSPGAPAAQAIRSSLDPVDTVTRSGVVNAANDLADFLDRPMTVKEQSDLVTKWNNEKSVSRFYNMSPAEQSAAELGDPSLRAKVTALNALRGTMFDTIDRTGGTDLGQSFREGRKDWGSLKSVASLLREARTPAPTGAMDKAGQILRMTWRPDTWGKVLGFDDPNRLATKSFNTLGDMGLNPPPGRPIPSPVQQPQRMLPASTGPTPLGSVPMTPPGGPNITTNPGTRATRLGLLLPPEGGTAPTTRVTPFDQRGVPYGGITTPPPSELSQSPLTPDARTVNSEVRRLGLGQQGSTASSLPPSRLQKIATAIRGPRYRAMAPDEQMDYLRELLGGKTGSGVRLSPPTR